LNGGEQLLSRYGGSLQRFLMDTLSSFEWKPDLEDATFWKNDEHCRQFIKWIEMRKKSVCNIRKESQYWGNSVQVGNGVSGPDNHRDQPTLHFSCCSQCTQIEDHTGDSLSSDIPNDSDRYNQEEGCWWYSEEAEHVVLEAGGRNVLRRFGGRLAQLLCELFPQRKWQVWRFSRVPNRYWACRKHRYAFMQWLAGILAVHHPTDWYHVTVRDVCKYGGSGLLDCYGNSLQRMLLDLFPTLDLAPVAPFPDSSKMEGVDVQWKPWLFSQVSRGFWKYEDNIRNYLRWLAEHWSITHSQQFNELLVKHFLGGGASLLARSCGLRNLLQRFQSPPPPPSSSTTDILGPTSLSSSKAQLLLYNLLRGLFPREELLLNFRHPDFCYRDSRNKMEVDIFLPSASLIFEYHGGQHYHWHYKYGSPDEQRARDFQKREACLSLGLTLIEIEFWKPLESAAIAILIRAHRPDLFPFPIEQQHTSKKLSASSFSKVSNDKTEHSDGDLPDYILSHGPGTIHDVILAQRNPLRKITEVDSSSTWWMSTLREGTQRAYWNGKGKLFFDDGRTLHAPACFLSSFPTIPLDGELWSHSMSFQRFIELLQSTTSDECGCSAGMPCLESARCAQWKEHIRFRAYDTTHSQLRIEDRIEWLSKNLLFDQKYVDLAQRERFRARNDCENRFLLTKAYSYYYETDAIQFYQEYHEVEAHVISIEDDKMLCEHLTTSEEFDVPLSPSLQSCMTKELFSRGSCILTVRCKGPSPKLPPHVMGTALHSNPAWHLLRNRRLFAGGSSQGWLGWRAGPGRRSGTTCYGCGRRFYNRFELQVQGTVWHQAPHSGPHPHLITCCPRDICILRASAAFRCVPFDGHVAVENNALQEILLDSSQVQPLPQQKQQKQQPLQEEQWQPMISPPEVYGIQWVFINS